MTNQKCIICGHAMQLHWQVKDGSLKTWDYIRCKNCDLIQLFLEERKAEWGKVSYSDDYYGDGFSKFTGAIQTLREFSAYRRACEITRLYKKRGRVLDIGCGEGLFLHSMQKLGWQTSGCEIGERAAKRAEALLQHSIFKGTFETMPMPENPWNVIMLWHVLEHLPNPISLFQRLWSSIVEDGMLIVAIPNAFSWQAKIFGPHWFHLDPPRHLYSFGLSHMEEISKKTEWQIKDIRHFSLEYNPYGWAQSFLNWLGYRRDAMYEVLKRHNQAMNGSIGLRILAWFLLGPSIFPAMLEAMAQSGGTMVLYLQKRKNL